MVFGCQLPLSSNEVKGAVMANLIITVISIALVAVAALLSAYYGGGAFLDGQAKVQANTLINISKQFVGGWNFYTANNINNYALTDFDFTDGTATDLVPNYLSELPHLNFVSRNLGFPVIHRLYSNVNSWSPGNGNQTNKGYGIITVSFVGISKKICEQVNLIAVGIASAPNTNWAGWTNTATANAELTPFRCVNYSGIYYFLYRAF